jgi:hypothetical protein
MGTFFGALVLTAAAAAKVDVAKVREDFHEARWVAGNLVRVAARPAAFASLAWPLVLDGRPAA